MRAITIWQPFATLIVLGLKKYETRCWGTSYRGPLIIHAAKRWDDDREFDCKRVVELLRNSGFDPDTFNELQRRTFYTPVGETLGKALGVVNLVDCQQRNDGGSFFENAVGGFGSGRFGWECASPALFETPLRAPGKQGLWIPDEPLVEAANELLESVA